MVLDAFQQRKAQTLANLESPNGDKSRKGSVDAPIAGLVAAINQQPDVFTTSSCSGRITVFAEPTAATRASGKKGGEWVFATHGIANAAEVIEKVKSRVHLGTRLVFRFEPFILAAECRSLSVACQLLSCARQTGFRESGATVSERVMVGLRCSLRLEVPVADEGRLLVGEEYLEYLVRLANEKMSANWQRVDRLHALLLETMTQAPQVSSKGSSSAGAVNAAVAEGQGQGTHNTRKKDKKKTQKGSRNPAELQQVGSSKNVESLRPGAWTRALSQLQSRQEAVLARLSHVEEHMARTACGTTAWTPLAAMPDQDAAAGVSGPCCWGHSSCKVGSQIVVFGGYGGRGQHARTSDVVVYDTLLGTWQELEVTGVGRPRSRTAHAAVAVGRQMLAIGGRTHPDNALDDVWLLDLDSSSWTQIPTASAPGSPMWQGSFRHSAVSVGSSIADLRVYVFGGKGKGGVLSNDVWLLQPPKHAEQAAKGEAAQSPSTSSPTAPWTWQRLTCTGEVPSPRKSHAACVSGRHMLVQGGIASYGVYFNSLYCLDLDTLVWTLEMGSPLSVAESSTLGSVAGAIDAADSSDSENAELDTVADRPGTLAASSAAAMSDIMHARSDTSSSDFATASSDIAAAKSDTATASSDQTAVIIEMRSASSELVHASSAATTAAQASKRSTPSPPCCASAFANTPEPPTNTTAARSSATTLMAAGLQLSLCSDLPACFSHSLSLARGNFLLRLGGCPAAAQQSLHVIDLQNKQCWKVELPFPRGLVALRHTAMVMGDRLHSVGGGAFCFSFGSVFSSSFRLPLHFLDALTNPVQPTALPKGSLEQSHSKELAHAPSPGLKEKQLEKNNAAQRQPSLPAKPPVPAKGPQPAKQGEVKYTIGLGHPSIPKQEGKHKVVRPRVQKGPAAVPHKAATAESQGVQTAGEISAGALSAARPAVLMPGSASTAGGITVSGAVPMPGAVSVLGALTDTGEAQTAKIAHGRQGRSAQPGQATPPAAHQKHSASPTPPPYQSCQKRARRNQFAGCPTWQPAEQKWTAVYASRELLSEDEVSAAAPNGIGIGKVAEDGAADVNSLSADETGASHVLVVPKEAAKTAKDALKTCGWLDKVRQGRVEPGTNNVMLPITMAAALQLRADSLTLPVELAKVIRAGARVSKAAVAPSQKFHAARGPAAHLKAAAEHLLRSKLSLTQDAARKLCEELPTKWEKLGDLVLIPQNCMTSEEWDGCGEDLWKVVAEVLQVKRVARQAPVANTGTRDSRAQLLLGSDGWVRHRESRVTFTLDVTRCMFSSGNVTERTRMGRMHCNGETVLDLFTGIGYYTLPLLVHAGVAKVFACEWNPHAVEALRRNLEVNGVEGKCEVRVGDCREVAPRERVCDRVMLGLLPSSKIGWGPAVAALRDQGGWLHVHHNVLDSEEQKFAEEILHELQQLSEKQGRNFTFRVDHIERVKWYAPHVRHVVLDVEVCGANPSNMEQPTVSQSNMERSNLGQSHMRQSNLMQSDNEQSNIGQSNLGQADHEQSNIGHSKHVQSNREQAIGQLHIGQSNLEHSIVVTGITSTAGSSMLQAGGPPSNSTAAAPAVSIPRATPFSHEQLTSCVELLFQHLPGFMEPGCDIPVLNAQALTNEQFHSIISPLRIPVVLRTLDLGPAPQKWTPEYLVNLPSSNKLLVSCHVCREPSGCMDFTNKNFTFKTMPLAEMVGRSAGLGSWPEAAPLVEGTGVERYYLRSLGQNPRKEPSDISKAFPELASDLAFPPFVPSGSEFSSVLRVASEGLRLWTHYDVMDNMLMQIAGTKEVLLWHPAEEENLYVSGSSSPIIHVNEPDLERFPKFRDAHAKRCILQPGDVLFLPSLWFHNVLSQTFSISVNVFWRHLPDWFYERKDLYGNRDLVAYSAVSEHARQITQGLSQLPEYYLQFYKRRLIRQIDEGLAPVGDATRVFGQRPC